MKKEELLAIKNTVNYDKHEDLVPNDILYQGIILKSVKNVVTDKHYCYLINENNKTLNHIAERPIGFINKDSGLVICFNKMSDINKIVHSITHYTIIWFDEPKTHYQITKGLIL